MKRPPREVSTSGLEELRVLTAQLVVAEEEKQLFKQAIEQMYDALVIVENNLICYVNRAFCNMYGYSKEEILGHRTIELFAGTHEEHQKLGEQFHEVFRSPNGLAKELEYRDKRKDGTPFWVSTTAGTVFSNQRLYWVVTIRDITYRRQQGKVKDNGN